MALARLTRNVLLQYPCYSYAVAFHLLPVLCGKSDLGMCGTRYDMAPLSAVVSETLHK